MSDAVKVASSRFPPPRAAILVAFCDDTLKFGAATRKALGRRLPWSGVPRPPTSSRQERVDARYSGAGGSQGRTPDRGRAGKLSAIKDNDFLKLGGAVAGKLRPG